MLPREAFLTNTPVPRVVLVGKSTPGEAGIGGTFLSDLVQAVGSQYFACAWLATRAAQQPPKIDGLKMVIANRRFETAYRPVSGIAGDLFSACALRVLRPAMIRKCEKAVRQLIDDFRPAYLLAILDSPASIQVAARIRRATGIPLLSLVWDGVELLCRQSAFDRWTSRWIGSDFAFVLRQSERIAVICENMQRAYEKRYGVSSLVLRHAHAKVEHEANRIASVGERDHWLIGYAGSMTTPDCFRAFVQALDRLNWKIGKREIALRMMGVRYLLESQRPQRIEFLGYRNTNEEARQYLAECDLLYLPQSFDADSRPFSELSFPAKLSTYVAAGRPILLHAPEYGSLAEFWNKHELGPWCRSVNSDALEAAMRRCLEASSGKALQWLEEGWRLHNGILGADEFRKQVRVLLGIGLQTAGAAENVAGMPASV